MNRGHAPLPFMRNEEVIEEQPDQSKLTPRYTAEVVDFIKKNKDQPFFVYMPHTFPHVPLFASEKFAGKSKNHKYGDAVEEIDWSVGEIFKTLKELGLDEKTLVVFTSDNGAQSGIGGSNAPLRGFKGTTWDGGQRIPCVMRWPGRIPAGTQCDELASTLDVLPTLAHLGGGKVPADRIIDGKDIWPLMADTPGAKSPHEAFFYYYRGDLQAVRSGQWKLMFARVINERGQPKIDLPDSLYDLDRDIGETTNVASENPVVFERLKALAEACRQDIGDATKDRQVAGKNCRAPGMAEAPTTLTHREVEPKAKNTKTKTQ
jgi:arylsulfatase A